MKTITQLVAQLANAGIKLQLAGENLRFQAPKGAMTAEMRDQIKARKPELITYLQQAEDAQFAPLLPVKRGTSIPLSFAQQRLWVMDQMGLGKAFNITTPLRMRGTLDVGALARTFAEIVQRHETLRTVFRVVNEQPEQIILSNVSVPLPLVDLTSLADAEQEETIEQMTMEEAARPFDLAADIPIRLQLLKLSADHHVLISSIHHIASDGWSTTVMIDEMRQLYSAFVADDPSPLPPLPIQYADFAIWQREQLQGERLEKEIDYWRRQLTGAPHVHQLPLDHARRKTQTFVGHAVRFKLSPELTAGLERVSHQTGGTLYMTLLSAFAVLVGRYSNQFDVVIGAPIANRTRKELEPLFGFFINMLAIRADLAGDPTFFDLLKQVKRTLHDAYVHQDVPFERIVEAIQPERNLNHNALVQVALVLNNMAFEALQLPNLEVEAIRFERQSVRNDMELQLLPEPDGGLQADWLYNAELFEAATVERMATHLETLLVGVVAEADRPISQLPIMPAQERETLLTTWNATEQPLVAQPVHELFAAQAQRTPDALAVGFEDGAALSYAELDARSNQLARHLQTLGVGSEELVAVCMERSPELLVAILGVLKAGGAYVPIDPTYPQERVAYMLTDAEIQVVLTSERVSADLPPAQTKIALDAEWEAIAAVSCEPLDVHVGQNDLAYCIYTSGSTGRPKGTLIEHRGLTNYLTWAVKEYSVAEGVGAPINTSISFDATITSLFTPLLVGKQVILLPEEGEIEALAHLLQRGKPYSLVKLTPTHLSLLSQLVTKRTEAQHFIIGGEQLLESHLTFWRSYAPRTRFINEYGPTETVVGCCVYDSVEPCATNAVPIGRPIANVQLYILDDYLQPVPIGVLGKLYIGGAGVARGYLNRPELTAERFIENPFGGGRLYATGDVVRWRADGEIEFLGRSDDQIKIHGYRIELGEIEAVLEAHEGVQDGLITLWEGESSADSAPQRHCVRCGLPSNHPDAHIDGAGVCAVCRRFAQHEDQVMRYFKTMDEFHPIVAKMRETATGNYDCMVLLSGGKDSTYVVGQMVEMGLRVLAFTLDNGFISEEAKENVQRVCRTLGVDHVFGQTDAMNAIFRDSLLRYSDVCNGCFKTIYTLSTKIAQEQGIKYIVTGISRGQMVGERLQLLFNNDVFDIDEIDSIVVQARKAYHRLDDVVSQSLDVAVFQDDALFDDVQYVDFYRYSDVELADLYAYLDKRVPWVRPSDTGRSTNCLINDAGIFVHQRERGYHNYALPYSWDVILGHKQRDEAMDELNDDLNEQRVRDILNTIGYHEREQQTQPEKRLVAYITPAQANAALEREQVENWRTFYADDTYNQAEDEIADFGFNLAGWSSSYTGAAIPAAEMAEWVRGTVASIRALQPRTILEIGCGTGLLLSQLAPDVTRYVGVDQAAPGLRNAQRWANANGMTHIELQERSADNFVGLDKQAFDVVVINSVAQYFPSIDYLLTVLRGAAACVRPGGTIFIGDVRNHDLFETFHLSTLVHQAEDTTTAATLAQQVRERMVGENELLIDPDFFRTLPARLPAVTDVQISLQRGDHRNELSKFRYQVTLQVGGAYLNGHRPILHAQTWQADQWTLETLRQTLRIQPNSVIHNIPNARLSEEVQMDAWLRFGEERVGELRSSLTRNVGVDPEQIWSLADALGLNVRLDWGDALGAMTAVFWQGDHAPADPLTVEPRPLQAYANNPLLGQIGRNLIPNLRDYLQQRLPAYMVPHDFVLLDALPMTPNGKVDRQALPAPTGETRESAEAFVAPQSPVEHKLAEIWQQVLGLEQVGMNDNFFGLGGDSIMSIQIVSRAKQHGLRVTTQQLFQHQTIAKLAQAVEPIDETAQSEPLLTTESLNPDDLAEMGFADDELDDLFAEYGK